MKIRETENLLYNQGHHNSSEKATYIVGRNSLPDIVLTENNYLGYTNN